MSVEAALKDNENRWEASFASHDPSVSQPMMASDFVGVYWDGKIVNKRADLQTMTGGIVFSDFKVEDLQVRVYGETGIVVGQGTIVAQKEDKIC